MVFQTRSRRLLFPFMTVSAFYKDQPWYTLLFVSWSGKKKGKEKKKRGPLPFVVLIALAVHDWFFRSGLFYSTPSMEQWHLLMCPFHWSKVASPFTRLSQAPFKCSCFLFLPVGLVYSMPSQLENNIFKSSQHAFHWHPQTSNNFHCFLNNLSFSVSV